MNNFPTIKIHDSLAAYLGGPGDIETFSLSVLDVAKLSGHLCPSVAGAFLATQAAVKALFPENETCERGLIAVDIPGDATEGANGPIGHVISFITGAWPEHGFGGLQGRFVRRNLMNYNSRRLVKGQFRFERLDTGKVVEISYYPFRVPRTEIPGRSFGENWQERVKAILAAADVIEVHPIN